VSYISYFMWVLSYLYSGYDHVSQIHRSEYYYVSYFNWDTCLVINGTSCHDIAKMYHSRKWMLSCLIFQLGHLPCHQCRFLLGHLPCHQWDIMSWYFLKINSTIRGGEYDHVPGLTKVIRIPNYMVQMIALNVVNIIMSHVYFLAIS